MTKIKDLPAYERPREKAQRFGLNTLSDVELLAIVIGSGTKNCSALEIAHRILHENKGLYEVSLLPFEEYRNYRGISSTSATKIAAVFELVSRVNLAKLESRKNESIDLRFLMDKYCSTIADETQETFVVICLDKKRRIIKEKRLYVGTENSSLVSIKEIVRELLLSHASYFYLIHNHPNGTPHPSDQDINVTVETIKKGKELGIEMIDHLIVSKKFCYSFKEARSFEVILER